MSIRIRCDFIVLMRYMCIRPFLTCEIEQVRQSVREWIYTNLQKMQDFASLHLDSVTQCLDLFLRRQQHRQLRWGTYLLVERTPLNKLRNPLTLRLLNRGYRFRELIACIQDQTDRNKISFFFLWEAEWSKSFVLSNFWSRGAIIFFFFRKKNNFVQLNFVFYNDYWLNL